MEFCGVESVSNCFTLWITPPWHGLTCTNPGAFSIGLPAYNRVPRVLKNCTSVILQFPTLTAFISKLSFFEKKHGEVQLPLLQKTCSINPSTHQPQFSTGNPIAIGKTPMTTKTNQPTNQPTNRKPSLLHCLGLPSGKAVEVQLFSSKHWQCHHR